MTAESRHAAETTTWPLVVAGLALAATPLTGLWLGAEAVGGWWVTSWLSILVVGAVVVVRAPGHRSGTVLFASGLATAASMPLVAAPIAAEAGVAPAELARWLEPIGQGLNTASVTLLPLLLFWFPDNRLPSHRWRWVVYLPFVVAATGGLAAVINNGWGGDLQQSSRPGPLREEFGPIGDALGSLFNSGQVLVNLAALLALVLHYRRGDTAARRQIRWLFFGVAIFTLTSATQVIWTVGASSTSTSAAMVALALTAIPVSIGIAIVRHRLFDIDVVISRTLLYVSILIVIAAVYVAIVFGVGSLIGGTATESPVLAIAATGLIAIVFHPVRIRLERLANRIVFGRRATPYEVLSTFTQGVAVTDEETLATLARSLAEGTVATGASVWSTEGGSLELISSWPERAETRATAMIGPDGELLVPGAERTYPISHDDRVIGAIGLEVPVGEVLPPADEALVGELAAGVGLALWNRELANDLRAGIAELRASRRRLVTVQDQTRHRLERDLHDGAQQRLVAVKVRLSIAQQMAAKAEAEATAQQLAALCAEADETIESLRDFARGVYPPLLESEGLAAALAAQVARSTVPIDVDCRLEGRQPRNVEATVYFCVIELVDLLAGAESSGRIEIAVTEEPAGLTIRVTTGQGSTPGSWSGPLPDRLVDRFEALDGNLDLQTAGDAIVIVGRVSTRSQPIDERSTEMAMQTVAS